MKTIYTYVNSETGYTYTVWKDRPSDTKSPRGVFTDNGIGDYGAWRPSGRTTTAPFELTTADVKFFDDLSEAMAFAFGGAR